MTSRLWDWMPDVPESEHINMVPTKFWKWIHLTFCQKDTNSSDFLPQKDTNSSDFVPKNILFHLTLQKHTISSDCSFIWLHFFATDLPNLSQNEFFQCPFVISSLAEALAEAPTEALAVALAEASAEAPAEAPAEGTPHQDNRQAPHQDFQHPLTTHPITCTYPTLTRNSIPIIPAPAEAPAAALKTILSST